MANFSKKIVSTVSATAIVATAMGTSFVSAASEFLPYAEALVTNKVIGAQSTEAGFRLNDQITRAELAKVAANLGQFTKVSCTGNVYSDVNSSLGDLCEAIETLASVNVINKNLSKFRPNDNVTRAEMTKMLLGALNEKPTTTSAGYADVTADLGDLAGFINRANEMKCANTATYFRPAANASRGEAFKIASCVAKIAPTPIKPVDPSKPGMNNGTVTVSAVGTATAQYVPMNASSVNVGTFKITATGGDVVLNSVSIGRSGLGNSSKVTIALADKTGRVSESRSVNSSTQEALVRLNNAITLKNGESIELSALATVERDQNAQHQFSVKAVNGQAISPVTLGLINTTSYETSTVSVDSLNTQSVTPGRNNQVFARVTLRAGSQDATIHGFTLTKTNGDDLTRVFANVNVYRNGTKVGKAVVTSDKVVVTELATDLVRNNSATYELRGDVVYVGSGTTLTVGISESQDVSATEKSTGYATQVSGYNRSGSITLSALDIVTTRKTTSTTTVSPGATNVLLIDGTITSEAAFDITAFRVNTKDFPAAGTATGMFSSLVLNIGGNDYELMNGDAIIVPLTGTGKLFDKSGDKFRVEPGVVTPVTLRASLLNNAATGKVQYEVELVSAKNTSNGNTVGISKKLTGTAFTISAPTLTLKNSTVSAPSGTKIFSNAVDLEIARFGLEAKADEVTVNRIVIENTGTIATLSDVFSNARLINVANGETVASSATFDANKLTFNSVTLRVNKDTTANLKLVVDTNGDLVNTNANQTFVPKILVANNDLSTNTSASATVSNAGNAITLTKEYKVSTNAPTVNVVPRGLNPNAAVAEVKVTNTDDNKTLTLKEVTLGISFRSTANGTVTFPTQACLRNVGSSASCGEAGTTALVAISSGVFNIAASDLQAKDAISSSNGTTEFEVFFPGNTTWVAGDNVSISVNKIKYAPEGSADLEESYVGTAGASTVITK